MRDNLDWDPDQLIRLAERELRGGAWKDAVALLRRALNVDEEHAHSHAMLALALLVPGRLVGAEAEAKRALELRDSPYGHYAMAAVAFALRRFDDAWTHCQVALGGGVQATSVVDAELEAIVYGLGAKIRHARGEIEPARDLFARAIASAPYRIQHRVEAARFELAEGQLDDAARHADEALRRNGLDIAANVIAGEIDLRTGEVAAAERHVQFALAQDATDRDALKLWAAIKARKQPALGWAWRAFVWAATRDEAAQTRLLVGSFLGLQLLMILANALGLASGKLVWIWMGFLLAVYAGPLGVHKIIQRETGESA